MISLFYLFERDEGSGQYKVPMIDKEKINILILKRIESRHLEQ